MIFAYLISLFLIIFVIEKTFQIKKSLNNFKNVKCLDDNTHVFIFVEYKVFKYFYKIGDYKTLSRYNPENNKLGIFLVYQLF